MLRLAERNIVDLTGRQLATLREENTLLRNNLARWYGHAAENDGMILCLHTVALQIIAGGSKLTVAKIEKLVAKSLKTHADIPMCKIVVADSKLKLHDRPGGALAGRTVLRKTKLLPEMPAKLARGKWKTFLHVPIRRRKSLAAVLVCASPNARAFPVDADTDYVTRLAELIAQALVSL